MNRSGPVFEHHCKIDHVSLDTFHDIFGAYMSFPD